MQYSNLDLTNALYNLTMLSLLLKTTFRLIIPKTAVAFFTVALHWLLVSFAIKLALQISFLLRLLSKAIT